LPGQELDENSIKKAAETKDEIKQMLKDTQGNELNESMIDLVASQLKREMIKDEELVKYEEEIADKSHIHFHENWVSLTVLCFTVKNIEEMRISKSKRGSVLWSCLFLMIIECIMLWCITFAIIRNENGEYG
jgi:hypothetical protein